jgi:hypothetical protein
MVKDHLDQEVIPGNYVFYHGRLYKVERTTEGQGPVDNFVHLQYAGEKYELVRLKRVSSREVCLVDATVALNYIAAQEIKRAADASQWPSNNY